MKSACGVPSSIVPLIVLVAVLSGAVACILGPWRVFASNATFSSASASGAQIAVFDEDAETLFDAESETGISPLLHAAHYQPAGYFPERSERQILSHPWMRILPFALLAVLALAAARFLGKRGLARRAGDALPLKKMAAAVLGVFLIPLVAVGISCARGGGWGGGGKGELLQNTPINTSVQEGVTSLLGEGREIYQTSIDITEDVKQMLSKKVGWQPADSSVKVYYSQTENGAVEAYAFVLSEILSKCGGTHKYCVKVSPDGRVEAVRILYLNCHHSFGINTQWFLDQFTALNTENAADMRVDAVTRATLSSDLTYHVVRRALALFEVLEGNTNA